MRWDLPGLKLFPNYGFTQMKLSSNPSEFFQRLKLIAGQMRSRPPENTDEFVEILHNANDSGLLAQDVMEILERVVKVSALRVRDVMLPPRLMVTVPQDSDLKTILDIVVPSGHSRFPVVDDRKNKVSGILLAKDILHYYGNNANEEFDIHEHIRSPVFVPESKRLNALLKEFREERNHMAIVVDEYGGIGGLVTIEDVLEEIVGDIEDEWDQGKASIEKSATNENEYIVDALVELEDFNEELGVKFDADVDTVGGLVIKLAGHLPRETESVVADGLNFEVVKSNPRRIDKLRVTRMPVE